MPNLSKAEIIKRLGMAPDQWVFRGQCYDCGDGNTRVCALTQRDTRFCFTLKPQTGKGKVTIGPASFYLLKRHAPDLYLQLERGRHWLQLMVDAESSDQKKHALRKRLGENQKKLGSLRSSARSAISAWRQANRRGELPEILANLRLLMERKMPDLINDDTQTRWCEQSILDMELELVRLKPTPESAPEIIPMAQLPAPIEMPAPVSRSFEPVPEIEF